MRFVFRQGKNKELQQDLNVVQDVLNSGYFIMIDLIFWAFLLTVFTTPVHHSLKMLLIVYICYYVSGIGLFLLVKKCFKSDKKFQSNNTEERERFFSK